MSDVKRDRVLREIRRLQNGMLKKTNMKRSGKAAKFAKQSEELIREYLKGQKRIKASQIYRDMPLKAPFSED